MKRLLPAVLLVFALGGCCGFSRAGGRSTALTPAMTRAYERSHDRVPAGRGNHRDLQESEHCAVESETLFARFVAALDAAAARSAAAPIAEALSQ